MGYKLRLNADIGEGNASIDESVMPFIQQANIACGGHAGNQDQARACIHLAVANKVAIGAHPSYLDRENFGRKSISVPLDILEQQIFEQVQSIALLCQKENAELSHIKAHGALYHDSNRNPGILDLLLRTAQQFNCQLMLQSLPNNHATRVKAQPYKVKILLEGFADRAYLSSGQLVPRSHPHAVHSHIDDIIRQAYCFLNRSAIPCMDDTHNNTPLHLPAQTLCVHGDTPLAFEALKSLNDIFH